MIWFGTKLSDNFAWEISLFHFMRKFSDGLSLFQFSLDFDWYKGDHNPKFSLMLIVINTVIIEFSIYNVNHVDK